VCYRIQSGCNWFLLINTINNKEHQMPVKHSISVSVNTDYRIRKAVHQVPNHTFSPHHYQDVGISQEHHKWITPIGHARSFRPFMMFYWPYRYWLVVSDQVDLHSLIQPCCFNIQDTDRTHVPVVPGHHVIGYRRQQDRNRDAKRNWSQIIGWAGGHFVY